MASGVSVRSDIHTRKLSLSVICFFLYYSLFSTICRLQCQPLKIPIRSFMCVFPSTICLDRVLPWWEPTRAPVSVLRRGVDRLRVPLERQRGSRPQHYFKCTMKHMHPLQRVFDLFGTGVTQLRGIESNHSPANVLLSLFRLLIICLEECKWSGLGVCPIILRPLEVFLVSQTRWSWT